MGKKPWGEFITCITFKKNIRKEGFVLFYDVLEIITANILCFLMGTDKKHAFQLPQFKTQILLSFKKQKDK